MISPTSLFPVIVALLLALATVKALTWRFGATTTNGRFTTIDGLRGYLAFFVFLHHSCVWYFYLKTSEWKVPPSNFFTHLGQSSVTLFFMITGFLFFTKILNGRTRGLDWTKLYVSRVLRLAPLYLFAMTLLFLTVAIVSGYTAKESPTELAIGALKWAGFTVFGAPNLNGMEATGVVVAGVTWSLPYEWVFYLCLPLLSIGIGVVPPFPILIIGLIGALGCIVIHASPVHLAAFASGIIAALLVRYDWFGRIAASKTSSIIAIVSLATAVTLFPTAYSRIPFALLSLSFALIAGGATLFGTLRNPLSCALGEMAYSLYLLHGLVLFTLFNFVIGKQKSQILSPWGHWLSIELTTPVLILICFATFRFIEKPGMQCAGGATRWVRQAMFTRRRAIEESL